jgi:hypothetical protein
MATDLLEVIAYVLLSDGPLELAFGRAGWCWRDLAPPDEALPVCVLTAVSNNIIDEPAATRGDRSRVEGRTFQVAVYATSPGSASGLADAVVLAIQAASDAGNLPITRGLVVDIAETGTEDDARDPDPGPNGEIVWSHTIELEAMIGR